MSERDEIPDNTKSEYDRLLANAKQISKLHHDLLVVMQAVYIEWRYGAGAEKALSWIENTLDGPGLIPGESEPYGKDAQAYYDANRSDPYPACSCGRPSNILWMGRGFCCEAHYKQAKNH